MWRIHRHHPHLRRNFRNSIFPVITFNFGPTAISYEHEDSGNFAGGMCIIQSGGKFDHKKGGHLYMREARLVVEFPSGSSILITSAAMGHGNVGIMPGETRTSMTQYAAGGLFRWIDQGYQTRPVLEKTDLARAEELDAQQDQRWRDAVGRFSKIGELQQDHMNVFYGRTVA